MTESKLLIHSSTQPTQYRIGKATIGAIHCRCCCRWASAQRWSAARALGSSAGRTSGASLIGLQIGSHHGKNSPKRGFSIMTMEP